MANDFARQLETLQPQLLRFARTQLRNEAWAEDAVSETVVAALEKPQAFAGQSQLKTWLVGILKHKVIDQLRRHKREATILTTDDNEDLDDLLFSPDGHWREMPADWGNPDDVLRQRQFFDVMQACLDVLPPTQARVFMMREWLELSSDEVCKELTITTTNLWVLLHRARLRLRECLQAGWFDTHPAPLACPMSLLYRNCREVTRLVLERENRALTVAERVAVRFHLGICLMCTRFTGQVKLMNRAMAQWKHYSEHDGPDGPAA